MDLKPQCSCCLYYDNGHCRDSSPSITVMRETISPSVSPWDWCGNFDVNFEVLKRQYDEDIYEAKKEKAKEGEPRCQDKE